MSLRKYMIFGALLVALQCMAVQQWHLHLSYRNAQMVAASTSRIYAIAEGSLFAYDRNEGQLIYMSKETGLSGSTASQIAYDKSSGQLIIAYEDGRIDLLDDNDNIRLMPDIPMKAGTVDMTVNAITPCSKHTYLAMPFGIIAINPRKAEVSETYYIGTDAEMVNVQQVVELHDSLFAFTDGYLYHAALADNLVDYSYWQKTALPAGQLTHATVYNNELYILLDNLIYRRHNGQWVKLLDTSFSWIHASEGKLLANTTDLGLYKISEDGQTELLTNLYMANDAVYTRGEYWMAESGWGLIHLTKQGDYYYHPDGPNTNFAYTLTAGDGRIYSANGGRWAVEYGRLGQINIYDGSSWISMSTYDIEALIGARCLDPSSIAVDPNDAGHFFVASYGAGLFEFRDYKAYKRYGYNNGVWNTTLRVYTDGYLTDKYTRVDGVMMDEQGNLWALNSTLIGQPVHVLTPSGEWYGLPIKIGGETLVLETPAGTWIDKRNSHRKWFLDQRKTQGVLLLDDNGTPTKASDDRCVKRATFTDQNGNTIAPSFFYCFAQDRTNRIWLGTENGPIILPANTDFFTSDACRRIIIPRNDGTGLGDYLLGDERINCMAVDGGNRMWIGTANSGLYLIADDTITVAHFTEDNSMLPSNSIQSIAIEPNTGEVFVGTDKGLASYHSDASEPHESMRGAYAYPNPVRPGYTGTIAITGLMENTVVNIVDGGGNVVCKTRSNGGTAVWDGNDAYGNRATPGVYTALCNAKGGHTVVKILVMN